MTKLEAVQLICAGLGVPAPSALSTGSGGIAGEAERFLDQKVKTIMGERWWHNNSEYEVELPVPDVRIEVGDITGSFTFEETITEGGSNATGTFRYLDTSTGTNFLYLVTTSGTFTGDANLVGENGGATVGATATAITAAKHAVPATWLRVIPAPRQTRPFARVGNFLFDPVPDA
jgi:hypothetical protein